MADKTCTQQGLGMALYMLCNPSNGPQMPPSQMLMIDKVMPLAQKLNGSWYSTEEQGLV